VQDTVYRVSCLGLNHPARALDGLDAFIWPSSASLRSPPRLAVRRDVATSITSNYYQVRPGQEKAYDSALRRCRDPSVRRVGEA